jgi:hypothetical protein
MTLLIKLSSLDSSSSSSSSRFRFWDAEAREVGASLEDSSAISCKSRHRRICKDAYLTDARAYLQTPLLLATLETVFEYIVYHELKSGALESRVNTHLSILIPALTRLASVFSSSRPLAWQYR